MPSVSALVYLYGDLFSRPSVIRGINLPWRNVRVDEACLAVTMFVAEFMDLMEGGHISLRLGKEGLPPTGTLLVSCSKPSEDAIGLARRILSRISTVNASHGHQDNVLDIVSGVIGKDCLDPWTIASEIAREELVQDGYLKVKERRAVPFLSGTMPHPAFAEMVALEGKARLLKARLCSFQERDPEFYSVLWGHVCHGLYSRQECADL